MCRCVKSGTFKLQKSSRPVGEIRPAVTMKQAPSLKVNFVRLAFVVKLQLQNAFS